MKLRMLCLPTADLPTPVVWVIMLAIEMAVLSYVTAMLIAKKGRKFQLMNWLVINKILRVKSN